MFYPVHLNIKDMDITIIGGGKIAFRKCQFFLKNEKRVTVVSEAFIPEFEVVKDKVTLIYDSYQEDYIKDSFMVIAATNNRDLNQEIGVLCCKLQKLVNVVDDSSLSNFIIPGHVKRGDLLLSVATGGKSPSLAAKIKRDLEEIYDETYERYVELLGQARQQILETVEDPAIRKEELNRLINLSVEELEEIVKVYLI